MYRFLKYSVKSAQKEYEKREEHEAKDEVGFGDRIV